MLRIGSMGPFGVGGSFSEVGCGAFCVGDYDFAGDSGWVCRHYEGEAQIAQAVEHLHGKQKVVGSIPILGIESFGGS